MTDTYSVLINDEILYVEVDADKDWEFVDGGEQCHDCGADQFTLHFKRGQPECLVCDACASAFPLRAEK